MEFIIIKVSKNMCSEEFQLKTAVRKILILRHQSIKIKLKFVCVAIPYKIMTIAIDSTYRKRRKICWAKLLHFSLFFGVL